MSKIYIKIIGSGIVTQKPARIGPAIQLQAIPNIGATFFGWKGLGNSVASGFSVCNVNPRYTHYIEAVFSDENNIVNSSKVEDLSLSSKAEKVIDFPSCVTADNNLVIIDSENSLMWKSMVELNAVSYENALKPTEFLGFLDWRLPTKEEFILFQKNSIAEVMEKGFYWTESKIKTSDFFDGYCEIINERGLVRLCDPKKFGNRLVRYVRTISKDSFKKKIENISDIQTPQLTVVDVYNASIVKEKTESRNLTDNSDGTISDYNTGLMWTKLRDGRAKNVQEAVGLTCDLAGYVDWRLPSSKELRTISPIDERFFPPPTRGYYFSKTSRKSEASSSFAICELVTSAGMTDSILETSYKEAYVRFVRYEDIYPITFILFGAGSGVVTKRLLDGSESPNPETCGYTKNSLIEIIAIPNKGSMFKEWRGDIKGQDVTRSILIDSKKSIIVEFELQKYPLTLLSSGQGEGEIISNSKDELHPYGSVVTLHAAASVGSRFKEWGGDLRGNIDKVSILMDGPKTVNAEFVRYFPLSVSTNGSGTVQRNMNADEYAAGSEIELIAMPENGHRFVRWLGDIVGANSIAILVIDGPKALVAEFEILTYPLILKVIGSGDGAVIPSTVATEYKHGMIVTLTATPAQGSVFKGWSEDASGNSLVKRITITKKRTVTAEFSRVFLLSTSTIGQDQGVVRRNPDANEYEVGSIVKLRAIPVEGYEFVKWHGESVGVKPTCTVAMTADKSILAEFRQLPQVDIEITYTGSGSGMVSPLNQSYCKGSIVDLVAKASDGCVFDGWSGDVVGLEATCTFTINANVFISAAFSRVETPDTDIVMAFDKIDFSIIDGREVVVFQFTVTNREDRQIHINIPMAGYVNLQGEEFEQTSWVKGMIGGEKGATLRPRTFRKMGLVFERPHPGAVMLGEHLHIALLQSKPPQRLNFAFRCTNASKQILELVRASVEPLESVSEKSSGAINGNDSQAELASRMQLLEKSLQDALNRLSAPAPAVPAAPTQTLPEVLAWLCTQNSVTAALLRQKLLPLGLMPSAVIDDVNERAFDLAGEAALTDDMDSVAVQRGVLLQVLSVW